MRVCTHLGLLAVFFTGAILGSTVVTPHAASAEEAAAPKPLAQMTVEEKLDVLAASALELNDDGTVKNGALFTDMNALWTCIAAFLVFFMQAGFAMVETGFTRAKNACNILMKNLMDFSMGTLTFWLVGFGLMFGANATGWFGTSNFLYDAGTDGFNWAFLIFQTVFCATAATIVSGAMAERTKFGSYLIYTVAITTFVYPIFGSWAWGSLFDGGGWLEKLGFHDFAGSTVVHSIGGWAALAGAIVLGPRIGKYRATGSNRSPGIKSPWPPWAGSPTGGGPRVGGFICALTTPYAPRRHGRRPSFAFIAGATKQWPRRERVGAGGVCSWISSRSPTPVRLNAAWAAAWHHRGLRRSPSTTPHGPCRWPGSSWFFDCVSCGRIRNDDGRGGGAPFRPRLLRVPLAPWPSELSPPTAGPVDRRGTSMLITQRMRRRSRLSGLQLKYGRFLAIKYSVGLGASVREEEI